MRFLNKTLFQIGLTTLCLMLGILPAFAAGELQIKSETGKPFLFQPKAGEVVTSKVLVRNLSKTDFAKIKLYPKDAVTTSDGRFDLLREDQDSKHVGTWIQMSKNQISLKPGETIEIPFILTMPKLLEPGQYIGGIVVQGEPIMGKKSREGVTFNLLPRTGVFVTVNAPGKQEKLLGINGFTGDVNYAGDEAVFKVELANMGNMTLAPKTHIYLKNGKGKTLKTVKVDVGFIVPGQKMKREVTVSDILHFGAAKAELEVKYADSKSAKASTRVLFVPGKLLAIGGVFLLIITAGGFIIAKKFDIQIRKKDKTAVCN